MQIQTITQENKAVTMGEKVLPAVHTVFPTVQSTSGYFALSWRFCGLFYAFCFRDIQSHKSFPLKK